MNKTFTHTNDPNYFKQIKQNRSTLVDYRTIGVKVSSRNEENANVTNYRRALFPFGRFASQPKINLGHVHIT